MANYEPVYDRLQEGSMLRIFVVLACLFTANLTAAAYAALTSLTTLTPSSSKGSLIKFDSIDADKGFELNSTKDNLIVKENGVYLLIISAQVGATSSAGSGYVDVWYAINGKPVPNSTARTSVENGSSTYTLVTEAILKLKAGDSIQNYFSASGPSLGCIFLQPDNEPALPSYEFIILKIDEL